MSSRIESLHLVEKACWDELARAAAQRDHPWRTAVLATTDGQAAHARTVIVREVEPAARRLTVYTDSRSPKAAQIAAHPLGTLVAWSAALGWQLRIACRLWLDTEGLTVSSRWARLKLTPAAQDYLSPLPPGTTLDGLEPARGTREYFALIVADVLAIDWLELHAEGHRRAAFDERGARWLQP